MAETKKQSDSEISPQASAAETDPQESRFAALRMQWSVQRTLSALAVVAIAVSIGWWATRDDGPTPAERMQTALEMLKDRDNENAQQRSRSIAKQLAKIKYRDPEFSGASEYIMGITAFRSLESLDDPSGREQIFLYVQRQLADAENGLPDEWRPEWAYALGVSLHQLGKYKQAGPTLEEAINTYPEGRIEASTRLIDIDLTTKTPESLARALELNTELLDGPELNPTQRDRAYLQQAHIYLALNQNTKADAAVNRVERKGAEAHSTTVLRAQILMAKTDYVDAMNLLEKVKKSTGLEREYPRQASYLMGVCHQQMGSVDNAISANLETARTYKETHEGLAANLNAASLLRQKGRAEESLKHYREALMLAGRPEDFGNRWLGLDEFQKAIEDAWNDWITVDDFSKHTYQQAIDLSDQMTPLFSAVQSYEFAARANKQWAEHFETELAAASYEQRNQRQAKLLEHWRSSGKAYAVLANALRASARYTDELWTSAEHYRRGHDFESALTQLTRFIRARPKERLPAAITQRGNVLMDLDRLDEAIENFRHVITNYPTDHVTFEARYVIGLCLLELGKTEEAEQTWREILTSQDLKPSAREWRLSLYSLGRLLYHTADMLKSQAERSSNDQADEETQLNFAEAFRRWEESIQILDQYLKRYEHSAEAVEARFLLSKALQKSAAQPRRKLQVAETENAKLELRRTIRILLEEAIRQFRLLQVQLRASDDAGQLDDFGQRMLRDCFFEVAHTHFALEQYDRSITAYNIAANRYPLDPQVLLAYIQLANCYDRLNRPSEARRMLLQAKVILKGMTDDDFQSKPTNMDKQTWEKWLKWSEQLHQSRDLQSSVLP